MSLTRIPTEAFAEHTTGAIGGFLPIRDCTQIALGKTYRQGGEFVATLADHLPDGSVVEINGRAYRLNVVGAAAKAA